MSSELVFYILSAARLPVHAVSLTYDCDAGLYDVCTRLVVRFQDGHENEGRGCSIFGALRNLMTATRTDPDYWREWKRLN